MSGKNLTRLTISYNTQAELTFRLAAPIADEERTKLEEKVEKIRGIKRGAADMDGDKLTILLEDGASLKAEQIAREVAKVAGLDVKGSPQIKWDI